MVGALLRRAVPALRRSEVRIFSAPPSSPGQQRGFRISRNPRDFKAPCSLIGSVCRSILIELNLPLPATKDIDGLIRAVQEPLNLLSGRMELPADIEADIRQVLGGLTSAAKGIGALRTHAGDAHGREKGFPRIARFAINVASSIALFLIDTWERKQHRALPLRQEAARKVSTLFGCASGGSVFASDRSPRGWVNLSSAFCR